jgi:hypothetical protein
MSCAATPLKMYPLAACFLMSASVTGMGWVTAAAAVAVATAGAPADDPTQCNNEIWAPSRAQKHNHLIKVEHAAINFRKLIYQDVIMKAVGAPVHKQHLLSLPGTGCPQHVEGRSPPAHLPTPTDTTNVSSPSPTVAFRSTPAPLTPLNCPLPLPHATTPSPSPPHPASGTTDLQTPPWSPGTGCPPAL